jgi:hypothetical protein
VTEVECDVVLPLYGPGGGLGRPEPAAATLRPKILSRLAGLTAGPTQLLPFLVYPYCSLIVLQCTPTHSSHPPFLFLVSKLRRLPSTRSEPLYSKKLEGSVVKSVIRCLTTDTRPTSLELSNPEL